MLYIHRLFGLLAALVILYIGVTGTMLQMVDMATVLTHASDNNPNMLAMREHIDGPPNYSVITSADYKAQTLPANFDYAAAIAKVTAAAHAALPSAGLRLVELRIADGVPAGHVQLDRDHLLFDAATGASLPAADIPKTPNLAIGSLRNTVKTFHKAGFIGRLGVLVNLIAGIPLSVLIFTGIWQYFRLLKGRASLGRRGVFWFAGGWWRSLHRWFSVAASLFLIWVTVTGLLLTLDCLGQAYNIAVAAAHGIDAHDINRDVSSPMSDAELPGMLRTTLASYRRAMPGVPIKVLRLRYFNGMPQGVVVADDADTTQLVFNTVSGKQVSETEPGYPDTGFVLGWQGHETLKKIHRGDYFGMTGRWTELIAGFTILYLSISGLKMYYDMWRKRKRSDRNALIWH